MNDVPFIDIKEKLDRDLLNLYKEFRFYNQCIIGKREPTIDDFINYIKERIGNEAQQQMRKCETKEQM